MKKLLLAVLILGIVLPCYAQSFVSYQEQFYIPDDDNFVGGYFGEAVEVGYSWKNVELGIEFSDVGLESTVKHSTFRVDSIMPTIKIKLPIKKFTPYVVGGFGYALFTAKNLKGACVENGWHNESVNNNRSIASKAGLGLQYSFTKNWSVFIEGVYRYQDTGEKSTLDTWGWGFGTGAKYYF